LEQRTVRLFTDALEDFFRRSPKADDEGVLLETAQVGRAHRQSTAGGNHGAIAGGQLFDELTFQFPKSNFAVLRKELRDGLAGAGFDQIIRVEEFKVQLVGNEPAHGRFARAHEANQGKVDNVAGGDHAFQIPNSETIRTPILSGNPQPLSAGRL
jgi:hypothetical protein